MCNGSPFVRKRCIIRYLKRAARRQINLGVNGKREEKGGEQKREKKRPCHSYLQMFLKGEIL